MTSHGQPITPHSLFRSKRQANLLTYDQRGRQICQPLCSNLPFFGIAREAQIGWHIVHLFITSRGSIMIPCAQLMTSCV